MRTKTLCLSVSRKNLDMIDLLDEYADCLNMTKAGAVFHILKDWNRLKLKERIAEMEAARCV